MGTRTAASSTQISLTSHEYGIAHILAYGQQRRTVEELGSMIENAKYASYDSRKIAIKS